MNRICELSMISELIRYPIIYKNNVKFKAA